MTIGDAIKKFREEHYLSQRQFALKCGISNGYISMLEKGVNPKTDEPIMPSITALKSIASAMGISLNDLLIQVDDMPVNLSAEFDLQSTPDGENQKVSEFINLFQKLTNEQQDMIIASMKGILSSR